MLYELATLTGSVTGTGDLARAARAWAGEAAAGGELLGLWRSEIGTLGQVFALRGFPDEATLRRERDRALLSDDPFHCRALAHDLSMESYAAFPFLPPPRLGSHGGVFEIRSYRLRPGGLPATLAGWEAALAPARAYTDHLVTNLYALDGAPRITHIWGFSSVEERNALRADHYARGLWPPEGGPQQIAHATSTIALAEPGLPIG